MRKLVFFIIILSVIGPLRGQTSYDVEYAQVCLIDSIAPDTVIQFWRFTQANNPGEYSVDMTFDLASSYTVEGTVLPCCSCLTEAMAANGGGGGGIGDIAMANPPPINALLLLSGAVLLALIIPRRKIAVLLILAAPAAVSAQPGTTYDIEHTCICLVDSIAADTVIQFWRFTQSNNPGSHTVDVTFDLGGSYTVAGTVLSCKDYYLGDNPGGSGTLGTLAMWTGVNSLGNSSVTESGTVLSSSFTGSFRVPTGTNAQEPVWAEGMIRYDTDDDAFEGYSNSSGSEFFFAEAAAASFTAGSVLFADANGRIQQDNSILFYDDSNNEFRVGSTTDIGNFKFQANSSWKLGDASSGVSYPGSGQVISFTGVKPDVSLSATGNTCGTFENTHSAGYGIRGIAYYSGYFQSHYSTGSPALTLSALGGRNNATETTEYNILNFNSTDDPIPYNKPSNTFGVNGGYNINWRYRIVASASKDVARIGAIVTQINTADTSIITDLIFKTTYGVSNPNLKEVGRFKSGQFRLTQYTGANYTGTPAGYLAVESDGDVIASTASDLVNAGRPRAYAEMYIDDTDPDTIAITAGSPADGTDWLDGDTTTTFTVSAGRITYTGTETAVFDIDFSGEIDASTNLTASVWIYKNNSAIAGTKRRQAITAATAKNVSTGCLISLATNDYIEVFFDTSTNGSIYINNANLKVIKL